MRLLSVAVHPSVGPKGEAVLLRQLQYFCAVVAAGSFTKAAETAFVSQSALSQQVKALEADLGCELLHREGRSFTPTPAGEHLYRRACGILEDVETLRCEVEDIAFGRPSRLAVGYLNRYDGWEVQGAVGAFARRHPHVDLRIRAGSHDGIYRMLLAGEVDLVFNDKRRAFSDDFVNRHLMTCYEYVEVSEGSRLSTASSLTVQQLAGQPCIVLAAPDQQETEQAYFRDVLNFACDFVPAETLEQARFLVAGNRGFLPVEAREDAAGPTGTVIRRIPLTGPLDDGTLGHLRRDYYAFWLKARPNPYAGEFVDILAGLFA